MSNNTWTILDKSGEKSVHGGVSLALTALNFDAQVALAGTYRGALDNIILGNIDQQVLGIKTDYNPGLPASNFAQREIKLLVRYRDTVTGKEYTLEIATPDLAGLTLVTESDFVVLDDAGIADAWRDAFEGYFKAPDAPANSVTVLTVQVVGRNI